MNDDSYKDKAGEWVKFQYSRFRVVKMNIRQLCRWQPNQQVSVLALSSRENELKVLECTNVEALPVSVLALSSRENELQTT